MKLHRPRTRHALISAGLLLLLILAFVGLQNWQRSKLSPAETQLVGTWRQTADDWGAAKLTTADWGLLGDRDLLVTSTDVQTGDVAQPYVAGKWRLEGDIIVLHGKSRTDGPFWPAILHSVWSSPYRGYTGFRIDSNDGVTMRLSVVRWDARGNVVPQAPQTCTWMRVK